MPDTTAPPVHGLACRGPTWHGSAGTYLCNCGFRWVAVPLAPEDAARTTGECRALDAADNAEARELPHDCDRDHCAGNHRTFDETMRDDPWSADAREAAGKAAGPIEAMQHDPAEHIP